MVPKWRSSWAEAAQKIKRYGGCSRNPDASGCAEQACAVLRRDQMKSKSSRTKISVSPTQPRKRWLSPFSPMRLYMGGRAMCLKLLARAIEWFWGKFSQKASNFSVCPGGTFENSPGFQALALPRTLAFELKGF